MRKASCSTAWRMGGSSRAHLQPGRPSPGIPAMVGLLECANRRECCHGGGRVNSGNGKCCGTQSNCRAGGRTNSDCRQERPQENRSISGAQSEGCAGRSDSLVLPGLRQELHRIGSRDTRGLSGKASAQIKQPEKRIMSNKQAPFIGSLPCFAEVTTLLFVSRGDQW